MVIDRKQILLDAADWYVRVLESDDHALADAFHDWLDADPVHAECWDDILETSAGLAKLEPSTQAQWDLPFVGTPPKLRRFAPRHATRKVNSRRARPFPLKRTIMGSVAAACALLLAMPSAFLWVRADEMTSRSETRAMKLADGSEVLLGPDSAIAVRYTGAQRDVELLEGNAWFEVARDTARPFRVKTDRLTVTVLGTGFDVRTFDDASSVSVAHGRVRVEDNAGLAPSRELTAGQWVTLDSRRRKEGASPVSSLGLWRQGGLVARGETVGSVIDQIRPWYRGRIIVLSPDLKAHSVTGYFRADDPVRSIGNLVAPFGGRVTTITPWLMIVSGE